MLMRDRDVELLVVDDDEEDFLIIADYLRDIQGLKIRASWCGSYKEALNHIRRRDFDIYFIDYRLGIKSGIDLLTEAMKENCEEPIIMLTGFGNYEIDNLAMQLGAVDYLVKSELTSEKVERIVRYALDRTTTLKIIKANERKYRTIFEKSKDIIFVADENLLLTDINKVAGDLLGYTPEECIGIMNLYDFIPEQSAREYLLYVLDHNTEIDDWEVVLRSKSGENKICFLSATREMSSEDKVYVQGIIHDITNLKKSERTTLQAEKLALTGRLVQTLAHEVRNPLNNISLSLEQIAVEENLEDIRPYLGIIERNTGRINDLITELLNTSKPAEILLNKSAIQDVLDDIVNSSIDRLTLKKIALDLDYPQVPLYIAGNKQTLVIAILNIVINAIEAMEEKTGRLGIQATPKDSQVIVTIRDNGCGISEEHIPHLFEPYFTQKRNGVGLGLASSLNLLQAHKANIEVSSVVGEGTVFTLTFPSYEQVASLGI